MDMIVSREKWTEFVRICQIEWHHDDEQELITVSNVSEDTFGAVFFFIRGSVIL